MRLAWGTKVFLTFLIILNKKIILVFRFQFSIPLKINLHPLMNKENGFRVGFCFLKLLFFENKMFSLKSVFFYVKK